MASRKSVLDDCTKVLLRASAGQIAGDRRYRAPSLDREPIASVLSKAHQFEILSSADTTRKVSDLVTELYVSAGRAIAAHRPTDELPADHPLLILEAAMILMTAVDQVVSTLMLQRANKSKGFGAYLKQDQVEAIKPTLDRLAEKLSDPILRDILSRDAGLAAADLDNFVKALTIQETRHFNQRFVDLTVMTVGEPVSSSQPEVKRPRGRPRKVIVDAPAAEAPGAVDAAPTIPPKPPRVAPVPRPSTVAAQAREVASPDRVAGGTPTIDELLSEF